jgi:hypothetical protein
MATLAAFILICSSAYSAKRRILYTSASEEKYVDVKLLYGLFTLTIMVMLWNYIFPINYILQIVLLTIALIQFIRIKSITKTLLKNKILIIFVVTLALQSNRIPMNQDSMFYHYQLINIYSTSNTIYGIANLNNHFGLFSIGYKISSFLNFYHYTLGSMLVNSAIVVICLHSVYKNILRSKKLDIGLCFSNIIIFCVLITFTFYNSPFWLTSPSPDLPTLCLLLTALSYYLLAVSQHNINYYILSLNLIFFSSMFRPFTLILGFLILLLLIISVFQKYRLLDLKNLIFIPIFILIPALERVISTGFPFYPFTYGNLNLFWAVSKKEADYNRMGIEKYQQIVSIANNKSNSQFSWEFLFNLAASDYNFIVTTLLIVIIYIMLIILKIYYRVAFKKYVIWLLFMEMIYFICIYYMAPQTRFLWSPLWLLVITSTYLLFDSLDKTNFKFMYYLKNRVNIFIFSIIVSISIYGVLRMIMHVDINMNAYEIRRYLTPSKQITTIENKVYFLPANQLNCGYTQFPCLAQERPKIYYKEIGIYKFFMGFK